MDREDSPDVPFKRKDVVLTVALIAVAQVYMGAFQLLPASKSKGLPPSVRTAAPRIRPHSTSMLDMFAMSLFPAPRHMSSEFAH